MNSERGKYIRLACCLLIGGAFCNAHLKADATAEYSLTTAGLQAYLHGDVNSVELRAK